MDDSRPVVVTVGEDDLDGLRPLWLALHRHHRAIGSAPLVADDAASWAARRATYAAMLRDGDGFLLAARQGAAWLGYAAVRLHAGPDDTFPVGAGWAEVWSLAVDSARRGEGVGSLLLDAVDARLAGLGVTAVAVAAMVENAGALRLYERRGFVPREVVLWRFASETGNDG